MILLAKRLEERSAVAEVQAIVTQLGECQTEDLEAAGSSPAYRTFFLSNDFDFTEKLGC